MSTYWKLSLTLAVSLGSIVGLIFVLLGIEHNSQNEFISEGGKLDLWYSMEIGLSTGGLATLIFLFLAAIVRIIFRLRHPKI